MRILLNALPAAAGGSITHLNQVVPRLAQANPDLAFILVVADRTFQQLSAAVRDTTEVIVVDPGATPLAQVRADNVTVPMLSRKLRADLIVSLLNRGPIFPGRRHILFHRDASVFVDFDGHQASSRSWRVRRVIAGITAKRADRVLAPSAYMAAVLSRAISLRSVPTVVHHGTDIRSCAEPAPQSLGLPDTPVRLACVANPSIHKDLSTLLTAFERVAEEIDGQLALTIDQIVPAYWSGQAETRALIDRANANARVHLVGRLDAAGVDALYHWATATVAPSLIESFGMTILESLSHHRPVICSDILAHQETGAGLALYYPAGDVDALAQRLLAVSATRLDPSAVNQHLENWSWDRSAQALGQIIRAEVATASTTSRRAAQRSSASALREAPTKLAVPVTGDN
jgi:glycosyltransferase involved in cell wall biosynthesis